MVACQMNRVKAVRVLLQHITAAHLVAVSRSGDTALTIAMSQAKDTEIPRLLRATGAFGDHEALEGTAMLTGDGAAGKTTLIEALVALLNSAKEVDRNPPSGASARAQARARTRVPAVAELRLSGDENGSRAFVWRTIDVPGQQEHFPGNYMLVPVSGVVVAVVDVGAEWRRAVDNALKWRQNVTALFSKWSYAVFEQVGLARAESDDLSLPPVTVICVASHVDELPDKVRRDCVVFVEERMLELLPPDLFAETSVVVAGRCFAINALDRSSAQLKRLLSHVAELSSRYVTTISGPQAKALARVRELRLAGKLVWCASSAPVSLRMLFTFCSSAAELSPSVDELKQPMSPSFLLSRSEIARLPRSRPPSCFSSLRSDDMRDSEAEDNEDVYLVNVPLACCVASAVAEAALCDEEEAVGASDGGKRRSKLVLSRWELTEAVRQGIRNYNESIEKPMKDARRGRRSRRRKAVGVRGITSTLPPVKPTRDVMHVLIRKVLHPLCIAVDSGRSSFAVLSTEHDTSERLRAELSSLDPADVICRRLKIRIGADDSESPLTDSLSVFERHFQPGSIARLFSGVLEFCVSETQFSCGGNWFGASLMCRALRKHKEWALERRRGLEQAERSSPPSAAERQSVETDLDCQLPILPRDVRPVLCFVGIDRTHSVVDVVVHGLTDAERAVALTFVTDRVRALVSGAVEEFCVFPPFHENVLKHGGAHDRMRHCLPLARVQYLVSDEGAVAVDGCEAPLRSLLLNSEAATLRSSGSERSAASDGVLAANSASDEPKRSVEMEDAETAAQNEAPDAPKAALALAASQIKICGLLGQGHFGCVYKAEVLLNNRDARLLRTLGIFSYVGGDDDSKRATADRTRLRVALKVPFQQDSARSIRRDVAEFEHLASVDSHRNVARVIGSCLAFPAEALSKFHAKSFGRASPHQEESYFAMMTELVENAESLWEAFRRAASPADERQRIGDLAALAKEMAMGVEHVHKNDVVHRDVHPRNFVVDGATGVVRLCDFGLARLCDKDGMAKIVRDRDIINWKRSPPETAQIDWVQKSDDVWAIGLALWELFGRLCFDGEECPPYLTDDGFEQAKSFYARADALDLEYNHSLAPSTRVWFTSDAANEEVVNAWRDRLGEFVPADDENGRVRIAAVWTSIPQEFRAIIASCLHRLPDQRPTAASLVASLDRLCC